MKTVFKFITPFVIASAFAFPALAQESTESPSPTAETLEQPPVTVIVEAPVENVGTDYNLDNSDVQDLANNLFSLISQATYLPFAAPLVVLLVGLFKRIPFLANTSAPALSLFFSVLVWAGFIFARDAGFATEFQTSVESLTKMGEMVLGFIFVPAVSTTLYNYANKQNVAILGHSRS